VRKREKTKYESNKPWTKGADLKKQRGGEEEEGELQDPSSLSRGVVRPKKGESIYSRSDLKTGGVGGDAKGRQREKTVALIRNSGGTELKKKSKLKATPATGLR